MRLNQIGTISPIKLFFFFEVLETSEKFSVVLGTSKKFSAVLETSKKFSVELETSLAVHEVLRNKCTFNLEGYKNSLLHLRQIYPNFFLFQ